MLILIANTMESSGFFVLNTFLVILIKRGWNGEGRRKCESTGFFVLNTFYGDTYKKRVDKRKKIRPTGMLVLFCYDNRDLQCAYSG